MDDLIESLQIFIKYVGDVPFPIHCEHDVMMMVAANDKKLISPEDSERLEELGWSWSNEYDCWISHKFGSC